MNRYRFLSTLLLLALLAALVACAAPAPTAAPTQAPAPAQAEPTAAPPPTTAPEPTTAPAAAEPVLIAFGHVGPVSDGGWTMTHDKGRVAAETALGGKIKTTMVESMPYSEETSRAIEQFIADGAKMVIMTSEWADFVTKVAEKHPEVKFLECDGHVKSDNESYYYVAHWDPTYLIGMAAGLMTKSNKLGYIGSFPVQSVYSSVNSFLMGARSVNPNATVQVVLIDSWFDPAKASQAANALIDGGADFVMDIMDETAALQVEEKRGVWGATWNTDQRRAAPTKYVSSVALNWDDFYTSEAKALLDGTWQGNRFVLLPLGQGVDRDAWGPNVPKDVQEKVDAVREKMLNEGYNPFKGPIKDSKGQVRVADGTTMTPDELYLWDWSVEGVSGLPN
jgi:basic membrane protein A and related proteins